MADPLSRMARQDMPDLMAQNGGNLIIAARQVQQPPEEAHPSIGQHEGIELRRLQHREGPFQVGPVCGQRQRPTDPGQPRLNVGVADGRRLRDDLSPGRIGHLCKLAVRHQHQLSPARRGVLAAPRHADRRQARQKTASGQPCITEAAHRPPGKDELRLVRVRARSPMR